MHLIHGIQPPTSGYIQLNGIANKTGKAYAHPPCLGNTIRLSKPPKPTTINLHKELAVINKSRNYCWAATSDTCFHFPRCLRINDDLALLKAKADDLHEDMGHKVAKARELMYEVGLTSMEELYSSQISDGDLDRIDQ